MNLVWFLTIATIFSITLGEFGQFPFGSPVSVSLTDILLTGTLGLLLIWKIAIMKKFFWPTDFKILALFWLVAAISLLFSGHLSGGLYLIRFIVYSGSFLLGYFLVAEKKIQPIDLLRVFGLVGLAFALLGFLQLLILPNFDQLSLLGYDPHKNRLTSTFLDPNFAASFLVLALFINLILYLNSKRREWLWVSSLELVALGLTFSRSGYLMFLVSALLIGCLKYRKLLLLLVPILILAILVPQISQRIIGGLTLDTSSQARIVSWQNGWQIFQQNPILGVGFDNLRQALARSNLFLSFTADGGNSGAGVDSSIIFILATTGIIGLLTYFFWWIKIFKNWPLIWGCLMMGLLIDSQFINSLFYPPIMLMIYLMAGGFAAVRKK